MATVYKSYVCTLDEETQAKALKELNEDPLNRQGAIDTFRQWIIQQKHFKCPTDDIFLLAFLRSRKFSQLEARRQLEKYLIHRAKLSDWTRNLDPGSPETRVSLDDGPGLILPGRDDQRRKILLFRPGYIRMGDKRHKRASFRLLMTMFDSVFLCDEISQVHGAVLMADLSRDTMANEMKITHHERMNFVQTWQKKYPARVKALHCYNAGALVEFVMTVIMSLMTDKMKDRMTIHSHGLETLYDHIPLRILPHEYLPDDHTGPSGGSEQQIREKLMDDWSNTSIRERIKLLSDDKFSIDMTKKDTGIPEASFRKLNVD